MVGRRHLHKLRDWGRLVSAAAYTPALDEFGDYRANHETALEIPLARSDAWKLRLGVETDYTSRPAAGRERLNTAYFAQLALAWE